MRFLAIGAIALALAGCGSDNVYDDPSLVSVADVDGTTVLVDADGHTLYTAAVEAGGKIKQLTFEDVPLYTFTQEGVDELTGDGFTDDFQGTHFEWSAARTDGRPADDSGGGFGY